LSERLRIPRSTLSQNAAAVVLAVRDTLEKWIGRQRTVRDGEARFEQPFDYAIGAADCTEVPIEKPTVDQGLLYSGKKKHHHVKGLCIVKASGFCCFAWTEIDGACGHTNDIDVWKNSGVANWLELVVPSPHRGVPEAIVHDAVLADKGFQGIHRDIGVDAALVMRKKKPGKELSDEDQEFNDRLEHNRVIVENFFGRMKMKFSIVHETFRGDISTLPAWFIFCVALTNLDIDTAPLRATDGGKRVSPASESD
jgi:hypothetical protein